MRNRQGPDYIVCHSSGKNLGFYSKAIDIEGFKQGTGSSFVFYYLFILVSDIELKNGLDKNALNLLFFSVWSFKMITLSIKVAFQ